MPASPPSPPSMLALPADRYIVLLGPEDGTGPNVDEDECDWLIAQDVSNSSGGDRLDTIKCKVDFGHEDAKRLQNTTSPVGFHRQLEVRRLDENGEPTEVVAWGMISDDIQEITNVEQETIIARLDAFLFGGILESTPYWYPLEDGGVTPGGGSVMNVHLPCVFNPLIDDRFEPNLSSNINPANGSGLFLHPESRRLPAALSLQDQSVEEWTLVDAVHWICWQLNPDEKYILNPNRAELVEAFEFDQPPGSPSSSSSSSSSSIDPDENRLRNVELHYGRNLPQLLDDLLRPFGYSWHLVHELNDEDDRETRFRFFRLGKGQTVSLYMQAIGERIDPKKTNLCQFRLNYNISRLANQIIGRGDFKTVESTFRLIPAWNPSYDDLKIDELEVGQPLALDREEVGRKFVLNEAGDYNGLRPGAAFTFSLLMPEEIEEECLVRRRRFLPCVSQHSSGDDPTSNGYILEWWDDTQEGKVTPDELRDPGWVKVKDPYHILEKECGIMFRSPAPPDTFLQRLQNDPTGESIYLRITCCVQSDRRISKIAEPRDTSPNGETLPLLLDLKSKFKYRYRNEQSRFYDDRGHFLPQPVVGTSSSSSSSSSPSGPAESWADEKDDESKLLSFVERAQDNNDQAEVSLSLTLMTSNHPEYKIGQIIDKVDGRNLTFNANSVTSEEARLLQIVGINRTLDGEQRTELLLETFELERREMMVNV